MLCSRSGSFVIYLTNFYLERGILFNIFPMNYFIHFLFWRYCICVIPYLTLTKHNKTKLQNHTIKTFYNFNLNLKCTYCSLHEHKFNNFLYNTLKEIPLSSLNILILQIFAQVSVKHLSMTINCFLFIILALN